jgi:hypothetical protein
MDCREGKTKTGVLTLKLRIFQENWPQVRSRKFQVLDLQGKFMSKLRTCEYNYMRIYNARHRRYC